VKRFANPAAILLAIGLVVLAVVHAVLFGFVAARLALPVALGVAAVGLMLAIHLGLLTPIAAWVRRRLP
jgi:hypothetical protein